jgi:hypothetical protein
LLFMGFILLQIQHETLRKTFLNCELKLTAFLLINSSTRASTNKLITRTLKRNIFNSYWTLMKIVCFSFYHELLQKLFN